MRVPNPAIIIYGGIWYFVFLLVVKNREADCEDGDGESFLGFIIKESLW